MEYITKVKLGAIKNLTEARFAAAAGADWVGFCFDKESADYISPLKAKAIKDWLTGPQVVGEFGEQTLEEIMDVVGLLEIPWIQVNNDLEAEELRKTGCRIIKVARPEQLSTPAFMDEFDGVADIFLCDSEEYQAFEASENGKTMLDCQVMTPDTVERIKKFKPFAINLKGEDETAPGMRDLSDLSEFMDQLLAE